MIKNFFQKNIKKGFTLVETLVAITILMISIGGPMVLVGNGINVSRFSRDQVTAFYLAQDAIEALRFIRDVDRIELVKTEDPFNILDDLIAGGECQNTCDIDSYQVYQNLKFDNLGINSNWASSNLSLDTNVNSTTYGYYGHDASWDQTKFTRSIKLEKVNDNEITISVTVTWDSGGLFGNRSFIVKESLFYWY